MQTFWSKGRMLLLLASDVFGIPEDLMSARKAVL
jgi:hypothetical protein